MKNDPNFETLRQRLCSMQDKKNICFTQTEASKTTINPMIKSSESEFRFSNSRPNNTRDFSAVSVRKPL
jgi:hypothetical protein